jgi:PPOX class probable FMN-dependent enzyme
MMGEHGAPFADVVHDVAGLRSLYAEPGAPAVRKQIDRLDANCRAFVAHSPFVLLASANADGTCDVSPKGGPPGFVAVLDEHRLAIGDLPGNNRIDSLRNIVGNPNVGLLFLVPGLGETLRVNGRAWVVRDDAVLAACEVRDRRPPVAIGVEVTEAYIHCAKAFRRSNLWQPEAWPDRTDMPSAAAMLRDHTAMHDVPVQAIERALEEGYVRTMW